MRPPFNPNQPTTSTISIDLPSLSTTTAVAPPSTTITRPSHQEMKERDHFIILGVNSSSPYVLGSIVHSRCHVGNWLNFKTWSSKVLIHPFPMNCYLPMLIVLHFNGVLGLPRISLMFELMTFKNLCIETYIYLL